jgi:hypothetical protein
MMALGLKARQAIQNGVDAQEPFRTTAGSVKGYIFPQNTIELPPMGRLPEEYQKQLKMQIESGLVKFMIYSYGTPIAWVLYSGTWIVPDVSYSVTTSHHQGIVRTAIANYDFYNQMGTTYAP